MLAMKSALLILAASLALTDVGVSQAQYTGPSAQPTLESIADVLKKAKDDQKVILHGYLIKQVSAEKYLFSDGQQEIQVEIDQEDFRGLQIDEKTHLKMIGEVEKDFLQSPEIEVDFLQVLPQ
ncbi:TIGR00156 family protein [Allopseudospirillum japonicum]|uniref:TIGR00156 family protein n=1 Tax=Allopseudospirillum japonicum TaxID=64971 RepID=A0A1H6R787_9GAMM|nr:NirD/YgiW/YdeI family stress tolerance protein [Allopseudospirillum japonicum]SEI51661.1 TIGR00156 family protein [Allopseudospirillum japonicum]